MADTATEIFQELPEETLRPDTEEKKNKKNRLIKAAGYILERYEFRYNLFAAKPEYKLKSHKEFVFLDERAFDNLNMELKMVGNIDIPDNDLRSLIGSDKISPDFDPIQKYVFSLPNWDGVDRFSQFLSQVQLKDEIYRPLLNKYFCKWFVAMVGSLVNDNCLNDTCIVFSGEQGRGKTRFFISLVPQHLRLHYTFVGTFNPRDKDHLEMLGTKIMINLDEMATLTRNDVETLKTTMSTRYIVLRRAFGRGNIHLHRRASFCGSINEDEFLTDQTGNRRWLPFSISEINIDNSFNIDLLYAQAFAMYKEGFNIYFSREDICELETYNEQFRRIPPEEEMLISNFTVPTESEILIGSSIRYYNTTDIANKLIGKGGNEGWNKNDTVVRRIGKSLVKLGYKQISRRMPGLSSPIKVWILKEITSLESERVKNGNLEPVADEMPF